MRHKIARLIIGLGLCLTSPGLLAGVNSATEEPAERTRLFRLISVEPQYTLYNRDPWPSADDMYDSLTDFYLRKSPVASLASPGELHRMVDLRLVLPISDSRVSIMGSLGRSWVAKSANYQGGTISLRKHVVHAGIGLRYCITGCDASGRTGRFSTFVAWSYGVPFLYGLSLQSPSGKKDYPESFGLFDESWSKFGGGCQVRLIDALSVTAQLSWAARGIIGVSLGVGYDINSAKKGTI